MQTDTKPHKSGATYFLAAAISISFLLSLSLSLVSCRTDKPPVLSIICIGDGFGGADCSLPDGTTKYLAPSELKNFWMTTEMDMQNFSSWCYKTTQEDAKASTDAIKDRIKSSN
jgi:hypothetical protein